MGLDGYAWARLTEAEPMDSAETTTDNATRTSALVYPDQATKAMRTDMLQFLHDLMAPKNPNGDRRIFCVKILRGAYVALIPQGMSSVARACSHDAVDGGAPILRLCPGPSTER
jgi:hypothetical protein